MDVYIFKKPGFKKRQSAKLRDANHRDSILVDVGILNDEKIMLLHAEKDYTLFSTFIHILGKIETESESWEVRVDIFKNWFRKTFGVNNRFDIDQRLEWLSNHGLIEFKRVSNDVLMTSLSGSNEILTASLSDPERVSLPIRDAQKPHGSTRDLTNQTNQAKHSSCRRTSYTDEQLSAAKFIFGLLKTLNNEVKEPNWDSWANEIRLMVERDGRSLDAIKELFAWANQDPFWRVNILSPGKLREKWDQLSIKRQSQPKSQASQRQIVPGNQRISGELKF